MRTFDVQTHTRDQFVNITDQVQKAVTDLGLTDGVVTVFTPHTTCGLTINENEDPDVVADLLRDARDGEVRVPDRLDPLAAVPLDDSVEAGE